jgi:hypothetical protein
MRLDAELVGAHEARINEPLSSCQSVGWSILVDDSQLRRITKYCWSYPYFLEYIDSLKRVAQPLSRFLSWCTLKKCMARPYII